MRIEGRADGGYYVISHGAAVMRKIPLAEAREDRKLAKAIERNSWERINGGQ